MFGVGTGEILLILVIAMLVVGPERMVEFASTAGRLLAKLRAETDSVSKEFREALSLDEMKDALQGVQSEMTSLQQEISLKEIAEQESAETAVVAKPKIVALPFADGETAKAVTASEAEAEVTENAESTPVVGVAEEETAPEEEEAVLLDVAAMVPPDEEVEPVVIEEVALVVEDDMAAQAQPTVPVSEEPAADQIDGEK